MVVFSLPLSGIDRTMDVITTRLITTRLISGEFDSDPIPSETVHLLNPPANISWVVSRSCCGRWTHS